MRQIKFQALSFGRDGRTPGNQSRISSTGYKPYMWNSYKSFEVIGNIRENPELLEAKK